MDWAFLFGHNVLQSGPELIQSHHRVLVGGRHQTQLMHETRFAHSHNLYLKRFLLLFFLDTFEQKLSPQELNGPENSKIFQAKTQWARSGSMSQ